MKLNLAVTAIAIAALVSVATEAQAQTTIYGCYVKNSGTVYRIKAPNTPTKCGSNATEFSWNMEGQVGPQGPEGPQGPQGPAGPSGASAWPGVMTRTIELTVPPGESRDFVVNCLPDQVRLSGGHSIANGTSDFLLYSSRPSQSVVGTTTLEGWNIKVRNTGSTEFNVVGYAHCRLAIS